MPYIVETLADGAQSADGTGAAVRNEFPASGVVQLDITAISGTLNVWLQGSYDGNTWFDCTYDAAMNSSAGGADVMATIARRNVNGTAGVTTTGKHQALYRNMAWDWVRVKWALSGTATFKAVLQGK